VNVNSQKCYNNYIFFAVIGNLIGLRNVQNQYTLM